MIRMPPLDPAVLARRTEIVAALRDIVPGEGVMSGGALPLGDGIVLGMAKFNRVLEIDLGGADRATPSRCRVNQAWHFGRDAS